MAKVVDLAEHQASKQHFALAKVFGTTAEEIERALSTTREQLQALAELDWLASLRRWLIIYSERYPKHADDAAAMARRILPHRYR